MNTLIEKFNLSNVRIMDFFQTQSNISKHLQEENLETLKLADVYNTTYLPAFNLLDEALKPIRKTGMTDPMLEFDNERDATLVGLNAHVKAFLRFPEPEKAKAAERLKLIIDRYGKEIQKLPLREETGAIANLLQDLKVSAAQADLERIGAMPYITKLEEDNTAFESLYNDRTRMEAAMETGKTKAARVELQEAFSLMVQTINALALLGGEAPYRRLADNINREVQQSLITVKQRASMRANSKAVER